MIKLPIKLRSFVGSAANRQYLLLSSIRTLSATIIAMSITVLGCSGLPFSWEAKTTCEARGGRVESKCSWRNSNGLCVESQDVCVGATISLKDWCKTERGRAFSRNHGTCEKQKKEAHRREDAAYQERIKQSPETARFGREVVLAQSGESKALAAQFPKLAWLYGTWCETKPWGLNIETRTYRLLNGGKLRWAGLIEPSRKRPGRNPYTVVNDYDKIRVLSDTDYELWMFRATDTGGRKTVVRLRKDSSKTLSEILYKYYEFPAGVYNETFSLIGGKQKLNNSKVREFKRCRWKAT